MPRLSVFEMTLALLVCSACGGNHGAEWQECPAPAEVDATISGPGYPPTTEVTIDSEGIVTGISMPVDGRMTVDVDFSASDPATGTATFHFPPWVGSVTDLAVDDVVHVTYHFWMWFWPSLCLSISRDGEVLVAASTNDSTCPPIDSLESFEVGDLSFQAIPSDCELIEDHCASWRRQYFDVSCPDLTDPVRILDGSEADIACGPGYHVAMSHYDLHYREINVCTDMPGGHFQIVVARRPM